MRLTPTERDRLLLFGAAELARARRARGLRLNVPVVSKSREEANEHFGWIAHFFSIDNPTSSQFTQEHLGWKPTHPALIPDLDRPAYFQG